MRGGVGTVVERLAQRFVADDMSAYAAALVYGVFFSLFPFVIFLLALLGFLRIPGFFDFLLSQARTAPSRLAPRGAGHLLLPLLHGTHTFNVWQCLLGNPYPAST